MRTTLELKRRGRWGADSLSKTLDAHGPSGWDKTCSTGAVTNSGCLNLIDLIN